MGVQERGGAVGGKSDGELEAGSHGPSKDSEFIRNVMGTWATHSVKTDSRKEKAEAGEPVEKSLQESTGETAMMWTKGWQQGTSCRVAGSGTYSGGRTDQSRQ